MYRSIETEMSAEVARKWIQESTDDEGFAEHRNLNSRASNKVICCYGGSGVPEPFWGTFASLSHPTSTITALSNTHSAGKKLSKASRRQTYS
jgi:hypothetical protein